MEKEIIFNIYVVITNKEISEFRAISYEAEGEDEEKIKFLKSIAEKDFPSAYHFDPPKSKFGRLMTYKQFSKLERHDKQFQLFEEIFQSMNAPLQPLVCVTPVVDGKVITSKW